MRFIQASIMITIFAVAGRLVSLAIAKPIPNWNASGIAIPLTRHSSLLSSNNSIDLRDAISSHGRLVEEKIRSALDNYEMNTGKVHPFAVKRNESGLGTRGPSSVPLINFLNEIWMGEISIGTPPQTLKVHLDTGAADMWVLQTGCSGIPANRDLWHPFLSKSVRLGSGSFQLVYEDGSIIQGLQLTDSVTIGGFTANPQTFGSATSFTFPLMENLGVEYPADGLLGLAFPSISRFGVDPFFESLVKQRKLINPTFSLKLSPSDAEIYIGGANGMLYNGDIVYTPVTSLGFWQVSMDRVRVNGIPILQNVPAVLDTGASYIFGDWEQVSELYRVIGGEVDDHGEYGYYYLLCESFPTISFTFGGKTFNIPPEVLRLRPLTEGSPYCFSAVVARLRPYPFWTIGVPFLQCVYSVFDYSDLKVGFAELA